jgi:hypothetical protein
MVDQTQDDPSDRIVAHARGNLDQPPMLRDAINSAWEGAIGTEEGRAEIAAALGIDVGDVHVGPPPLVLVELESGFTETAFVLAIGWAGLHIGVPVLAGLAKDVIKDRLLALWRVVLLPAIRQGNQAAINEEQPLP